MQIYTKHTKQMTRSNTLERLQEFEHSVVIVCIYIYPYTNACLHIHIQNNTTGNEEKLGPLLNLHTNGCSVLMKERNVMM